MSIWVSKLVILVACVVMFVVRAPHGFRSREVAVKRRRKGPLETALLTMAWIAYLMPFVWIVSPVFAATEYPLRPIPLVVGSLCLVLGLWLFYRSHADLGTNWSITLELREGHQLITEGIYRRIRHPMYLALFVYAAGQALVVPNYVVGPSYGLAMLLVFVFRVRPEEQMMREEFGNEYEAYMARTKRLMPGVW